MRFRYSFHPYRAAAALENAEVQSEKRARSGQCQLWTLHFVNQRLRDGENVHRSSESGPFSLQSPSSSSAVGLGAAPDRDASRRRWARAMIRARMRRPRRTVSRCSAECAVVRRLVDGLRSNSFTSLRSAATHRIAALARECAQSQRGIRPLIGLRRDATPYRLSFFRPLPRSAGGVQDFESGNRMARGANS